MISKTKPFGCAPIAANTGFKSAHRPLFAGRGSLVLALMLGLGLERAARADNFNPEVARMLEGALADAENFRKQLPTVQYDARMNVQEWDDRGRLRGTVKAHAIVRPGDPRPMTFISREVQGKVRLPDDKPDAKDDDEKETTLQEFAHTHHIAERFEFDVEGSEEIAGEQVRRVAFTAKPDQTEKNTADRFLDTISGTAWISEDRNKLVKFEMRLVRPFQLFWIFAVLKELSIQYELLKPGEILGHARVKVAFALKTPIYTIRQLHEVDVDNFRRRDAVALAR
jgi:hypothetical protein